MRTITLKGYRTMELWSGRRLYLSGNGEGLVVKLPGGAMSLTTNTVNGRIGFGSATKSSVIVEGANAQVQLLFDAIVTQERSGAVTLR